ncbi:MULTISPECIES: ABC transporter ATP-binding protein [Protofrankia]|uniref:ABC transporter related protein n=2 Tax=Protofrankia TaxID=2994361 RepID=F8AWL5_9ACTN|nr:MULTISPECIES: ABC transporter ATP-binding protein [Protofrankia]AEH09352.1 ABC transporter related protein [Candidatus Protofrankia datiscae]KLL10389.1 ABC transporter [Protofrankia coriariae]ONH33530.1 ABC transporter ATP-binding protein [Protofrankia sp. BMG5.30]
MTAANGAAIAGDTKPYALSLRGTQSGYGRSTVLRAVDLDVPAGGVVALLGANGAGKTTLLRTAAGLNKLQHGHISIGGADHSDTPPYARTRAGLCLIPEGRGIFRSLSVRQNLRLLRPPWLPEIRSDRALEAFPALRQRLDDVAGTLSGGQQQMLALCRAYLSNPQVILVDEVSMGLAPRIIDEIFASLRQLAASGVSLVIVEQYVERAVEFADAVVVLRRGKVVFNGTPDTLDHNALVNSYLGSGDPVADRS